MTTKVDHDGVCLRKASVSISTYLMFCLLSLLLQGTGYASICKEEITEEQFGAVWDKRKDCFRNADSQFDTVKARCKTKNVGSKDKTTDCINDAELKYKTSLRQTCSNFNTKCLNLVIRSQAEQCNETHEVIMLNTECDAQNSD
jgi:hypothetical protein